MDIFDDMQKQAKLTYALQLLTEQITTVEHELESLKERRIDIFIEMRSLRNPISYDEMAHLSGMSLTRVHRLTKQAKQIKQNSLQRQIDDGSIFTKESGLSFQEQVELFNAQRAKADD